MVTAGELRQHATRMKKLPTYHEALMKKHLDKVFDDSELKTQCIIGFYIVDFVLLSRLLIIEVDGPSHDLTAEYDQRRTMFLEAAGFTVIRFSNTDVWREGKELARELKKRPPLQNSAQRFRSCLGKANALKGEMMRRSAKRKQGAA